LSFSKIAAKKFHAALFSLKKKDVAFLIIFISEPKNQFSTKRPPTTNFRPVLQWYNSILCTQFYVTVPNKDGMDA